MGRAAQILGVLSACALATSGAAQARRVADIDATPVAVAEDEREVVVFGGAVYYAGAGQSGIELYRAPLAGGGRQLVKDIHPGPGSSAPFALTAAGGQLFFAADDGTHGFELWRSDGSAAGTVLVRDVHPGLASSMWPVVTRREPMGSLNGHVYFGASDGRTGRSLWRSDGTTAGTVLVRDLHTDVAARPLGTFTRIPGALLFAAAGPSDQELWVTDGTAGGTRVLATLGPYTNSAADLPARAVDAGSAVYFGGRGALQRVTWAGGAATARAVRYGTDDHVPFCPADPGGRPGSGGVLFAHRATLIYTDGVQQRPLNLRNGLASYVQRGALAPPESCFFGFDLQHGNELWITDGTVTGTRLLADIHPGPPDARRPGCAVDLVASGTGFFFAADDGVRGEELWFSDGSQQGTQLVADVTPGAAGSRPRRLTAAGGGVVFVADHPVAGAALWFAPGPSASARLLDAGFAAAGATADDHVRGLFGFEGAVYFAADDGQHGTELWRSDGTAAGTALVSDLRAGGSALREHDLVAGSTHGALAAVRRGAEFWFTAYEPGDRLALFASAGTAATTRRLGSLALAAPGRGYPLRGATVDDVLYFGASGAAGAGLWRSSGAAANTRQVVGGVAPDTFVRLGPRVTFLAHLGGRTWMFASDGTVTGTLALHSWSGVDPVPHARVGRLVCFAAGDELWATDGTPAGTAQLAVGAPSHIASAAGRALCLYDGGAGTSAATTDGRSVPAEIGAFPGHADGLVGVGRRCFFALHDGGDAELWVSDGTPAGTSRVRRFTGGANLARVRQLTALGAGRVAFSVDHDADFGAEVWTSDGTPAGTGVLADINPGPAGSVPQEMALAGGRLFVVADATGRGARDLFVIDAGATATPWGPGAGASGFVPELRASDPALGGRLDVDVTGAPPRATGVLLIGRPAQPAVALSSFAFLYVDPAFRVVLPVSTDADGAVRMSLPVPAQAALRGFRFVAQAGLGPTALPPLGVDLSGAVLLVPF